MPGHEREVDELGRDPDLPEGEAAVLDLPLVPVDGLRHGLPLDERLEPVEEGEVEEGVVDPLVEEDLDGGDGAVAVAGGDRGAELRELDVVEPVLEPPL